MSKAKRARARSRCTVDMMEEVRMGRPATTRDRVLAYWANSGPCTIAQVCRDTGAERSHVHKILSTFAIPRYVKAGTFDTLTAH